MRLLKIIYGHQIRTTYFSEGVDGCYFTDKQIGARQIFVKLYKIYLHEQIHQLSALHTEFYISRSLSLVPWYVSSMMHPLSTYKHENTC